MVRRIGYVLLLPALFLLALPGPGRAASRGLAVVDASGQKVGAFTGSYALLVGVSNYSAGWPKLESVPGELDEVEQALEAQGFEVRKVLNPGSRELSRAFEEFVDAHGFDAANRLVFYFAGHGYTLDAGKKGYLVPADAPDPRKAESDFRRRSLDMTDILAWSRKMTARHALFLFDSCFSGTIFKTRDLPDAPPHISAITARPVRQFIAAGSAGEAVPARSVFAPSVVRALRGEADLTRDGYVTGTELGLYLREKVMAYGTGQTPQYGKIKDPDLDEGDFVFRVGAGGSRPGPGGAAAAGGGGEAAAGGGAGGPGPGPGGPGRAAAAGGRAGQAGRGAGQAGGGAPQAGGAAQEEGAAAAGPGRPHPGSAGRQGMDRPGHGHGVRVGARGVLPDGEQLGPIGREAGARGVRGRVLAG